MPRGSGSDYNRRVGTTPGRPLDLLSVDNQDVVQAGLKSLVLSHPTAVRSVLTATDVTGEVDLTCPAPDIVVLDYWLGRDDTESLDAVSAFVHWGARVVLYTSEERAVPLRKAVDAGVDAVCLRNDGMPNLVDTLALVAAGQPVVGGPLARALGAERSGRVVLTAAEQTVLQGLSYGLTPAAIAKQLFLAESTVRTHERNIHAKYRDVSAQERMSRGRMLFEALRDGYWDARGTPGPRD